MIKGIVNAAAALKKNAIRYSQFYSFENSGKKAETVAIKYVMQGTEHYQTENQSFQLNAGEFLLLNTGCEFATFIDGKELTEGLCVDLDNELFKKAHSGLMNSDDFLLTNPHYVSDAEITEGLYKISEHSAGAILSALGTSPMLNAGFISGNSEEHYFSLAEALTIHQLKLTKQIGAIRSKKPSVQKELYRRIFVVRSYINERFNEDLPIDRLSYIAQMSPFHFIRTFKQVHGVSPHQFLLSKRLEESYKLLISNKFSVSEVADNCGFADIFSFSKSFKKKFGVAPSCIKTKKAADAAL